MIRALSVLLTVGFVVPLAVIALAVEVAPRWTAGMLARIPVVGGLLTTACWRCDAPALTHGMEEMPVVFRPGGDAADAFTIRFCGRCSRAMTVDDRLALLKAEADKRGVDLETVEEGENDAA